MTLQHALQSPEGRSVFVGNTQSAERGCEEDRRSDEQSGCTVLSETLAFNQNRPKNTLNEVHIIKIFEEINFGRECFSLGCQQGYTHLKHPCVIPKISILCYDLHHEKS